MPRLAGRSSTALYATTTPSLGLESSTGYILALYYDSVSFDMSLHGSSNLMALFVMLNRDTEQFKISVQRQILW